jgi:hypothetical protein
METDSLGGSLILLVESRLDYPRIVITISPSFSPLASLFVHSWRVVEDSTAHLLSRDCLVLVLPGTLENLLLAIKPECFIWRQIVAFEETADTKTNLSLTPVRRSLEFVREEVFLDRLNVAGAILENSLDEFLILLLGPIVSLLHIEVLEVQGTILKDDTLAVFRDQGLSHLDHVVALVDIELVKGGTHTPLGEQMGLRSCSLRLLCFHIFQYNLNSH